ncbi:uncharacterized protein LACBIDRAFT_330585 [Laccaria bicolor S238N-H82]|uniref:Predicted protein n=1 Tax=Laccaria bicolor (strain S238N-H82 / ATCC MYA-4686) TaxID=486041 RepID=B0DLS9_LACBS|nr:uncharacterized protein LACBIDRAFT_330585 [Laccaria bicolor S238N-H82]EDR04347.1 predicted protein [Laccaria bicolor S238N-H82]|eukprot:XP_001884866.1 predicted protein [Laccaria bicolor S238N-H82]
MNGEFVPVDGNDDRVETKPKGVELCDSVQFPVLVALACTPPVASLFTIPFVSQHGQRAALAPELGSGKVPLTLRGWMALYDVRRSLGWLMQHGLGDPWTLQYCQGARRLGKAQPCYREVGKGWSGTCSIIFHLSTKMYIDLSETF